MARFSPQVLDDKCFVYYKINAIEVTEQKATQNLARELLTSCKKIAEMKVSIIVFSVPYDLPLGLHLRSPCP